MPAAAVVLEAMFHRPAAELFTPEQLNPMDSALSVGDHRHKRPATTGLDQLWHNAELAGVFEEVTRTLTGSVDRRRFLAVSGASLAAAHAWLIAEPARLSAALSGKTVDASVVADLNASVDTLRRLDDKLGGQAVYGMVVEQLRLTTGLLRNGAYSSENGRALYASAAELARLAGWTVGDAGDRGAAQRYYLVGLRAAHEANDPGIAANILRCMAHQSRSSGDPATAVDLLRSARKGARGRLSHIEEAVIAAHLARSYGRMGDQRAALSAADDAYSEFGQATRADDPPYLYWVGPQEISHSVGTALLHTGDAKGAISHLSTALELAPTAMPRDRIEHQARLALAYAMSGDTDAAVSLTHDAVTEAPPSAILSAQFTEVCREVSAAGHPGAAELAGHVRTVLGPSAA
jgi:tetratricopeptide (TPR) repeat protein